MMPFNLSFEVDGDKIVNRRLDHMSRNILDMSPAFEKMHSSFLEYETRQFATQGTSGSGGWAPLSKEWLETKTRWKEQGKVIDGRRVVDTRILHMTLRLRGSLKNKTDKEHIKEIAADQAFFGTKVPYAGVHQNPKSSNKGAKRRRPIELTESQRRAWARIAQRFIVESERA